MRSRFSELVDLGVASFHHTPLAPEMPNTDPIIRTYNNVFGLATDTQMTALEDGRYAITGHVVADVSRWNEIMVMPRVNGVESTYSCLNEFLRLNGLCGSFSTLNGDVVYLLGPCDVTNVTTENKEDAIKQVINSHLEAAMAELETKSIYPGEADVQSACECFALNYNFS